MIDWLIDFIADVGEWYRDAHTNYYIQLKMQVKTDALFKASHHCWKSLI